MTTENIVTIKITGRPGSGKSVIAQQIADYLQTLDIPVSLDLLDIEPRNDNCLAAAIDAVREHGIQVDVVESIKPRVIE